MVPSLAMNSMSSGIQVLCIQNERMLSSVQLKSMPCSSGIEVRYIRPRACSPRFVATSTWIDGLPGAAGNFTDALGISGPGSGSVGQMLAGSSALGASAGVGTTQGGFTVVVAAGVAVEIDGAPPVAFAGAAPAAAVCIPSERSQASAQPSATPT